MLVNTSNSIQTTLQVTHISRADTHGEFRVNFFDGGYVTRGAIPFQVEGASTIKMHSIVRVHQYQRGFRENRLILVVTNMTIVQNVAVPKVSRNTIPYAEEQIWYKQLEAQLWGEVTSHQVNQWQSQGFAPQQDQYLGAQNIPPPPLPLSLPFPPASRPPTTNVVEGRKAMIQSDHQQSTGQHPTTTQPAVHAPNLPPPPPFHLPPPPPIAQRINPESDLPTEPEAKRMRLQHLPVGKRPQYVTHKIKGPISSALYKEKIEILKELQEILMNEHSIDREQVRRLYEKIKDWNDAGTSVVSVASNKLYYTKQLASAFLENDSDRVGVYRDELALLLGSRGRSKYVGFDSSSQHQGEGVTNGDQSRVQLPLHKAPTQGDINGPQTNELPKDNVHVELPNNRTGTVIEKSSNQSTNETAVQKGQQHAGFSAQNVQATSRSIEKKSESKVYNNIQMNQETRLKEAKTKLRKALLRKKAELESTLARRPINALLKGGIDTLHIKGISDSAPEEMVRFVTTELLEESSGESTDNDERVRNLPGTTGTYVRSPNLEQRVEALRNKMDLMTKLQEAKEKKKRLEEQKKRHESDPGGLERSKANDEVKPNDKNRQDRPKLNREKLMLRKKEAEQKKTLSHLEHAVMKQEYMLADYKSKISETEQLITKCSSNISEKEENLSGNKKQMHENILRLSAIDGMVAEYVTKVVQTRKKVASLRQDEANW